MILICSACNARYLVPASVFASGPRSVRCARCAHTWVASSSDTEKESQASEGNAKKESLAPLKEAANLSPLVEPPQTIPPIPENSALPSVWQSPWKRRLQALWLILPGGVFLACLILAIVMRDEIAEYHPWTETYYNMLGLEIAHVGDGLSLQNIHSERRFEDGLVQLVVIGEVRNESEELLILPALMATALGGDGQTVQSWRIPLSAQKLAPSAVLAFKSVIRSPSEQIAEVNLRFVEIEEDGKLHE